MHVLPKICVGPESDASREAMLETGLQNDN